MGLIVSLDVGVIEVGCRGVVVVVMVRGGGPWGVMLRVGKGGGEGGWGVGQKSTLT